MDETLAPTLDPGRGKTMTGYFWELARDDCAWIGPEPPVVAFTYAPGHLANTHQTYCRGLVVITFRRVSRGSGGTREGRVLSRLSPATPTSI